LTETKVALAAEEQVCASLEKQKTPLEQRVGELVQLIEQRRTENASFLQRKTQAESEIEESRRHMNRLGHEREQINCAPPG
jgi:phage shock protein A